jgi:stress response protein SCP2
MKTFEVSLSFQDRTGNSESSTVKIDATSIPGAIAKVTREFVKKLDRKQRFDMNKNGLAIKAVHIGTVEKESAQAETA